MQNGMIWNIIGLKTIVAEGEFALERKKRLESKLKNSRQYVSAQRACIVNASWRWSR